MNLIQLQKELKTLQNKVTGIDSTIEEIKREIQALEVKKLSTPEYCVNIAGLWVAKVNSFVDLENPYGKLVSIDSNPNVGENWLIPSWDNWKEIYENTSQEFIKNTYHPNGLLLTDKTTKNELFLPALGHCNVQEDTTNNINIKGYYWSSSRCSYAYTSYYLDFYYTGTVFLNTANYRSNGFSVRCILKQ